MKSVLPKKTFRSAADIYGAPMVVDFQTAKLTQAANRVLRARGLPFHRRRTQREMAALRRNAS